MKRKTTLISIIAILLVSLFMVVPIQAATFPNLPTNPVTLVATEPPTKWPAIVYLSGIGAGYDVTDSPPPYAGWCYELGVVFNFGSPYSALLKSSLDEPTPWDKISYLINNKMGTGIEIQIAIWLLLGYTETDILNNGWGSVPTISQTMCDNANNNGGGFVPAVGQLVAVLCVMDEQDLFIELEKPPEENGYEGLTPGFWKNCKFDWVGYSKGDSFNAIFGTAITINQGKKGETGNPTFDEALRSRDGINEEEGIYDALARHAVAALLNAAHPDVNYPMTEQEIIDAVAEVINNAVYDDAEPLKNMLEAYNQLGGGIDAHGNPI